MASQIYAQIKTALRHLNPEELRQAAERPLSIGLIASSTAGFAAMEDALMPPPVSRARRFELVRILHRVGEPGAVNRFDLVLCEGELLCPPDGFRFDTAEPSRTAREVLDARADLALALARNFAPFRRPFIGRMVREVSKENATFALIAALPALFPSLAELPRAIGEFASGTAFITMNQVRLAFVVAAASDHDVGWYEQRSQIAAIVGGAVGWRALAGELAGRIPPAAGLVPKAAIAYAGTYTVGLGLERFYRLGYGLTRAERRAAYEDALEKGKAFVAGLIETARLAERGATP